LIIAPAFSNYRPSLGIKKATWLGGLIIFFNFHVKLTEGFMKHIPVFHPPGHGEKNITMLKIAPGDFLNLYAT